DNFKPLPICMNKNFLIKIGVVIIKKRNIVLVAVFVLILVSGIRLFISTQEINSLKEDTISYLTDKGYDILDDIEEMNIVDIDQNEQSNAVIVTFKDEPKVDYFYTYDTDKDHLIQIDAVNKGTEEPLKHQES
ncbi:hypothetical protein RZN25_18220, partial [Bacillaceae bacterium S4-13-56]